MRWRSIRVFNLPGPEDKTTFKLDFGLVWSALLGLAGGKASGTDKVKIDLLHNFSVESVEICRQLIQEQIRKGAPAVTSGRWHNVAIPCCPRRPGPLPGSRSDPSCKKLVWGCSGGTVCGNIRTHTSPCGLQAGLADGGNIDDLDVDRRKSAGV